MCEMQSFIPWKQISFQDMPSDIVEDRSEMTALNSQAATFRGQADLQLLHTTFKHWQTYEYYYQKKKQINKQNKKTCCVLLQIHILSEISNLLQPRINRTFNGFGAKCLFSVSFQFEKTDYNGSEGAAN